MKYIHPFPARMGSDVAFEAVSNLPLDSIVLDPMIGSGTVLRAAAERGFSARGFDLDPIAILISKVDTSDFSLNKFIALGEYIQKEAIKMENSEVDLPWIDECKETSKFIEYWFAPKQKDALRKIAFLLYNDESIKKNPRIRNALKLAMSRMIITKEPHASLARDTARSRPHKMTPEKLIDSAKDFDVIDNYGKSIAKIAKLLRSREKYTKRAKIYKGDARNMKKMESESIDAIITSPPYLNAIDYMRGHKMSLVWLGHSIPKLRKIRTESVGAENGAIIKRKKVNVDVVEEIYNLANINELKPNLQKMVKRYIHDMINVLNEAYRVLKYGGNAVYVVGDSCLRGVVIKNSDIIKRAAENADFKTESENFRDIPINKRSLPFPQKDESNALNKRMRYEHVITFRK